MHSLAFAVAQRHFSSFPCFGSLAGAELSGARNSGKICRGASPAILFTICGKVHFSLWGGRRNCGKVASRAGGANTFFSHLFFSCVLPPNVEKMGKTLRLRSAFYPILPQMGKAHNNFIQKMLKKSGFRPFAVAPLARQRCSLHRLGLLLFHSFADRPRVKNGLFHRL